MSLLAQYPIQEGAVSPYFGRPVAAVVNGGDVVPGVAHRVVDGHLVMSPLQASGAAVASLKRTVKQSPAIQAAARRAQLADKAHTRAFGWGGYPYGWGYGNWGWGFGWWWIWPLFFLLALLAFPFWW